MLDGKIWRYHTPTQANTQHHHAELEMNLVIRGSGTYLLGSRRYQIRPGDMVWLFPAQEHVLVDYSSDFEMWIAVFKHRLVKRTAVAPNERALGRPEPVATTCRRLAQQDLGRLAKLLAELDGLGDEASLLNAGLGYALLQAWRSFECAGEVTVRDVHPAVERAARLIGDGSHAMSLEQLAHEAGLSAARLSRLFKEQTGIAMVPFRNRQRIQRYLEIYGTGQRHTMLDAALEAGFGSYPQFHRVFKGIHGCSPARYRYVRSMP